MDYFRTYSSVFFTLVSFSPRLLLTLFLNMWRMLVFIEDSQTISEEDIQQVQKRVGLTTCC